MTTKQRLRDAGNIVTTDTTDTMSFFKDPTVPTSPPVPPRYRGVWRRSLLETRTLSDTGTIVHWLQTSRWHADLRLPTGRPDFTGVMSLAECNTDQLEWLATQQGFAGVTRVDQHPEICHWHRIVDFQPAAVLADAGYMAFDGDRVVETGVHAPYLENWDRLPGSQDGFAVFQQLDAPSMTLLLVAGDYVMRVRDRRTPWPAGIAPGTSLLALLEMDVDILPLLDCELSFGRRNAGGWLIDYSTLPFLQQRQVDLTLNRLTADRALIDSEGETSAWQIHEWTPPTAKK